VIGCAGVAKEDVNHPVFSRHRHVIRPACMSAAGDALIP
jgi:hypothetical protein